jgi:hypothetical protein
MGAGAPGSETPGLSRAVIRGVPLMPNDVSAQAQPKFSPGCAAKARDLARRPALGTGGLSRRCASPSAVTTALMVTRPMGMRSSGSPG